MKGARSIFRRIAYLHGALQRGRRVRAAVVAEELGVCRRTIYRDILLLIELGAPLDRCAETRTWSYAESWSLDEAIVVGVMR